MFFVLFLSLLSAAAVVKLYLPLANVGWDEAHHLYWSYQIYSSLKEGNLSEFVQVTFRQFGYPPLQSWVFGLTLIPFGFSIFKARLIVLVWFVLGSVLIYLLGKTLDPKRGKLIGSLASLLFLTSPMMLLHAGLAGKEMIGASLTLAVLLSYIRARQDNRSLSFAITSFFLISLFMTKYNYGILTALALILEGIINLITSCTKRFGGGSRKCLDSLLSHLIIFVPLAISIMLWLSFSPSRISQFLTLLKISSTFITAGMTDSFGILMFYPKAIIYVYSASMIVGILLLISLLLASFFFQDYRIRVLWLIIIPNLLLGTILTSNMQERYIFTSIPPLFILGAYTGVIFTEKIISFLKNKTLANYFLQTWITAGILSAGLILLVKIIIDLRYLPQYVYPVGAYTQKSPIFNQVDFADLWFDYDTRKWPKILPPSNFEKPSDVADYIATNIDLGKPVSFTGRANDFSPDYFNLIFALHKENGRYPHLPYPSFSITLEVIPNSKYYTKEYQIVNAWTIGLVREVENNQSLKLLTGKTFPDLGVRVGIYVPKGEN